VSPFSFAARLVCEAPTSRAVANRRMDLSLASRALQQRQWAGARPILQATYLALPACEEPAWACTSLPACEAPTSVRAAVNGRAILPPPCRRCLGGRLRYSARWRDRYRYFGGHPNRGPRQPTQRFHPACEVPTSRGAATNGLEGFPPSIQAGSRGEARYPGREAGPVRLFSGHAQGVFPFPFTARLACEAPTSKAVANRLDSSLASRTVPRRKARAPSREAGPAPMFLRAFFSSRSSDSRTVLTAVQ